MTNSKHASEVLLLDVMGTLVTDPFYDLVPAFFGIPFKHLVRDKHPTAWIEFELGKIDEQTFLPKFFEDQRSYDHAGLKNAMATGYDWLPGMETLIGELAALGVTMHALSNYTKWYGMIEQRTRLSRYVRWSFVSCDTGVRKPDLQAYLGAAEALSVEPSACLFIDDRATNCKAAKAAGMATIQFENHSQLRSALQQRGVLRQA